ncbi:MAG: DUF4956 domain-containing protein [Verrucomicrobiae bacterium]|nr:DUF4956 domain-containing protein [Verrucomicrobiae bacterium]MCX7723091.1 DUF4956 domain-containing protein [Verrucomicrobiae bacterium]MDW7979916.1 DUF4956 domain-containing protein [Verrucomicrobiales bacterium]
MLDELLQSDFGLGPTNLAALLLGLLLALIGGHVLAWVYMITHSGLSYSKSFVRALVVMPVAVSLVMNVLANNIIVAFGMMAVFAIVRFRNLLRDTLDTAYILLVLVLGMATGSQKFTTAVVGLVVMVLALLYLWATSFGARRRYDLVLNVRWTRPPEELPELERLLNRFVRRGHRTTQRTGADPNQGTDLSYLLLLRDPARGDELVSLLRRLPGVTHVSAVRVEDESEV